MSKQQNRSFISLLNAVSAVSLTFVNGILGIIVTRMVIDHFGSDFNGLNSTANQIINVLLVLEGGFTLASNVALFSPLTNLDYKTVNNILSITRKKFNYIGIIFLIIGFIVTIIYSLVINSGLSKELVFTVIIMAILPASFNLYYAATYRVLLQTQQKEYVINLITMFTIGIGYVNNIVMIYNNGPMWAVRFITMIYALINSILIVEYVKQKHSFLNIKQDHCHGVIKGTRDVMAQKVTGVIYNSAPIVFLSILPSGGTMSASVYAVYNNVFLILKSILYGVIDAPRLGFGQILTEKNRDEIWPLFAQYEYIVFYSIFVTMNTAYVMILPFISLYTKGITDIDYYNNIIALLIVLISVIEMAHIPSGHLINMAGEFKISTNFQIMSCILLIITMSIGGILSGVYGLLLSILIVAISLAMMEMWYVHVRFFKRKLTELQRLLLPFLVIGVFVSHFEQFLFNDINNVFIFVAYGIVLVFMNSLIAIMISFVFCRSELYAIIQRGKKIFS